ncbi:MAG: chaperone modulator CbpM [Burkholderiaceae bacterium]|nr:chaperone modulator CbpM [Burkholderiaceae bacterium]
MNTSSIAIGVCLTDEHALELEAFAAACGTEAEFVRLLVDEGLLQPLAVQPAWRFGGEELARVRRIHRLQRDFEANLQSVAVMLDLLDEVERLRAALQRAGIAPP